MNKSIKLLLLCTLSFFSLNLVATILNAFFQIRKAKMLYPNNFTISLSSKGIIVNNTLFGLFEGDYFLIITVVVSIAVLSSFLWFTNKVYGNSYPLALRKPKKTKVVILLIIGSLVIFTLIEKIIVNYLQGNYFDTNAIITSAKYIPLLIAQVIILSPLIEEIFFRGILYNYLTEKYNVALSIFATSFLFTVLHSQYGKIELMILFCSALVSGYLRHISNSLYPPIAFHTLNNIVPFLFFLFKK